MEKYCDLHTHSVYSDGTLTPGELIDAAISAGLSALALTDHNTITGLKVFTEAAQGKPIEIVRGTEFTTAYQGTELHILGLFIQPDTYSQINAYINQAIVLKDESNFRLIKKLREHGYDINYVDILERSNGYVNRANIAAELVRKGYLKSISEGFETILSRKYGLYEPPERLSSLETISFIRSIGAIAVWAHPYINMSFEQSEEFLPKAIDCGLQGMETVYSLYSDETAARAARICQQYDLLPSGGSDFHGANKPDIVLGKGKGNLSIPYEFYMNLRTLAKG